MIEIENRYAIPATMDSKVGDSRSIAAEMAAFDAAEHSQESELEPGTSLQEDEEEEAAEGRQEAEPKFWFQGEMDPFSFAEEDDTSGSQPYERFEHYEVLAARKRLALQGSLSGMPAKRIRGEDSPSCIELLESMNRKKSRKNRKRGRRKGSRNNVKPAVGRKLSVATLHYANGRYEEAIRLLDEVVLLAPNLSDPYHILGMIHNAMDDKKKAFDFYMIAAKLTPKNYSLWKSLVSLSIDQGDERLFYHCLDKAIIANPNVIDRQRHRASLFNELGEYLKAADSYEKISRLCPNDIQVLEKATQLYKRCGQCEKAVCMLEDRICNQDDVANSSILDLLASVLMESNAYAKVLEHIERITTGKEIPLHIGIKAGICHVHLGQLKKAEAYFSFLKPDNASTHPQLIIDVADALKTVGHCDLALKYYLMLEEYAEKHNDELHLKIARCYASLKKGADAIEYYYKVIMKHDDDVDARLALASLLLEENSHEKAIAVLSPPVESGTNIDTNSNGCKLWWSNGKIKLKLAQIYKYKGSIEVFADVLFPVIHETLSLEAIQQKVRVKRRLSRGVLLERAKVLNYHQPDSLFHGFRPVASSATLSKASRAKKLLEKKAAQWEAQKVAALAAGIDWKSDDSDDESPQVLQESPLPDFLKEEEHHLLIIDLCKSLSASRRYWDALEIINLCLKLESNTLSVQTKDALQTLGAQLSSNISDPPHGWDFARSIVRRDPKSISAWNCYYKGILRNNRLSRCKKFLNEMRVKHKDLVPPALVYAHMFTMIGQHQTAAREYLEAHKLMPDNSLINLCAGTALMNLGIGHRLQNKHQTILQGLAFLYKNARLCKGSQEALYNIARAYHHAGLVTLAAVYYEKVLAICVGDYPIPTFPNDSRYHETEVKKPGYCDLRREAAYNLHLIYKKSGAIDLARQILKDHVVL